MNWRMIAIAESGKKNDIAVTDRLARILMGLDTAIDGGPGSGNYGHKGIPGHHGGSLPQGESQGISQEHAKEKGFVNNGARSFAKTELNGAKNGYKFDVHRNKGVVSTFEKTPEGWRHVRKNEKTGKVYEDRTISEVEMANMLYGNNYRSERYEPEESEKTESVRETPQYDPEDFEIENEGPERIETEEEGFEYRSDPRYYGSLLDKKSEEDDDDDSDFFCDEYAEDGGPGSGNFNHAGNPGHVGGSAPAGRVVPRNKEHRDRPSKQNYIRASYNDVTKEYKNNATPGRGKFVIDPGVNLNKRIDEIQMAKWIHNTFGGDIRVLEEKQKVQGEENPDFEWRNKLWELKTPDEFSYNAINKRAQKGLRQIKKNPGGLIMDLSGHDGTFEDAEKAIGDRMRTSAKFDVDVIVLRKGDEYRILRYKTSPANAGT